jgi:YgiT-type zinc finger domain-containing protein
MNCPLCGGKVEKGTTTLTFDKAPEEVIVIKNVPAEVCGQCGEVFVDFQITRKVEKIVKSAEKSGLKMGFLEFEPAA